MNVISKRPFLDAARKYPKDRSALLEMFKLLQKTDFHNPDELRAVFPSLDNFKHRDKWWVLDVGGNNLRIIAFIQFVNKRVYIKYVVNHAEYEKLTDAYRKVKERK